jgi:DNA-binding CsgD family transcriptional regulator
MTETAQTDTARTPFLETNLELIDLPVGLVDAGGVVVWTNEAVADLLGARVGDSFLEFLPEELHDAARGRLVGKLRGAAATTHRLDLLGQNGRRVEVVLRSSPVRRNGSAAVLFVVIPLGPLQVCGRASATPLTPRQEQVLRLLAEGLDTEQIAERLGVALETARNHIRGLLNRLEVHSRLGAVLEGLRRGVLELDAIDG